MSVDKGPVASACWRAVSEADRELREQGRRATGTMHGAADVFAWLFRAQPEYRPDGHPADRIIEAASKQGGVEAVRMRSALSVAASALVARSLLQETPGHKGQRPGDGDGEGEDQDEGQDGNGEPGDQEGDGKQGEQPGPRAPGPKLTPSKMKELAELAETARAVEESAGCAVGIGSEWKQPELSPARLQAIIQAAEAIHQSGGLRAMFSLLGAFEALADAERRKAPRGGDGPPVGMGRGGAGAVARASPMELLRLSGDMGPDVASEALLRLMEGRVEVTEGEGLSRSGMGPIVALVDCSSSMGGAKQEAACALSWMLANRARLERRPFAAAIFNGGIAATIEARNGALEPADLMRLAAWQATGGTDFTPPFEYANGRLRQFRGAAPDVVLITDGAAHLEPKVADEFRELARPRGARLVLLGLGIPGPHYLMDTLRKLVDEDYYTQGASLAELAEAVKACATRRPGSGRH